MPQTCATASNFMPFPQVSSHTLFNIPFNFSKSRTAVAILEVITPSMYASVQCTHEPIHWNQGQLTVSKTFSFILYSLDGLLGGFCMGIPFPAFLALPHLKAKAQKVERCLKGIDDVGFRFVEGQPQSIQYLFEKCQRFADVTSAKDYQIICVSH